MDNSDSPDRYDHRAFGARSRQPQREQHEEQERGQCERDADPQKAAIDTSGFGRPPPHLTRGQITQAGTEAEREIATQRGGESKNAETVRSQPTCH